MGIITDYIANSFGVSTGTFWTIIIIGSIILLGLYLYTVLAFYATSKKVKVGDHWAGIAWIPFAWPYLMSQMAKKHWWPAVVFGFYGFLIPLLFLPLGGLTVAILSWVVSAIVVIYMTYWTWHICEERERAGWLSIISPLLMVLAMVLVYLSAIVSLILNLLSLVWWLILWGVLAWGD